MKVLIFGTTYESTPERANLHDMWIKLHTKLNPHCDILLVDFASPWQPPLEQRFYNLTSSIPHSGKHLIYRFSDNIGHLESGGMDGWARSVEYALQYAIQENYDYVGHIEGDSLCRLHFMDVVNQMQKENINIASVGFNGIVETALMFFKVDYVKNNNFMEKYNWPNRPAYPKKLAEEIFFEIFGSDLTVMEWGTTRGGNPRYDIRMFHWITKCTPKEYTQYFEEYMKD